MKVIPSGAVPIENPPGKFGENSLGFFRRVVYAGLTLFILIAVFALSAAGAFAQTPTITTQPVSQSVSVGSNVTFSVVAIGLGQLSYQWLLSNTPITGATSATLNLTNVQSTDSGTYTVIVANTVGVITSNPATLVVLQTPVINSPTSASGYIGIPFQYQIIASNSPTAFAATGLPAGLALNSNGIIAGVPTTTGTYTVGLTGTNTVGTGTSFPLAVVISPTPGIVFSPFVGDGSGNSGSADGTGSAATFNQPNGLATDALGNLYVADTGNSTIRKVTPSGFVTTFAGSPGQAGSADGVGTNARFSNPCGVAVDGSGYVYVADTGNHTIRKISPTGSVSTLAGLSGQAGSSDGAGSIVRFNTPSGIALDASNNLYIADSGNDTIRVSTPGGVVSTLAGLAGQSGNLDAFGIGARFNYPTGIAVDPAGNIYVLDSNNQSARKVSPQGSVSTIAVAGGGYQGEELRSSRKIYFKGWPWIVQ